MFSVLSLNLLFRSRSWLLRLRLSRPNRYRIFVKMNIKRLWKSGLMVMSFGVPCRRKKATFRKRLKSYYFRMSPMRTIMVTTWWSMMCQMKIFCGTSLRKLLKMKTKSKAFVRHALIQSDYFCYADFLKSSCSAVLQLRITVAMV